MDKTKQLIHIKQIFLRAENLAKKNDDISLIMLTQMLDFVVDSFLKLVIHSFPAPASFALPQKSYYYKITQLETERYKPNMDFYRAWDEVVGILREPSNGIGITDLPLRRDMDRLHEIRNDVQHKGAIPNPKDIYRFVSLVESFLENTYQDVFAVEFKKLSALSLIKDTEIVERLEKAYSKYHSHNWTHAFCEAAIAWHLLLKAIRKRAYAKVVKDTNVVSDYFDGRSVDLTTDRQRWVNGNLFRELERLQDHVAIIGLGADYARYIELEPKLPDISIKGVDNNGIFTTELIALQPWVFVPELQRRVPQEYNEEEAIELITFVESKALEFRV